ncbi:MAG: sel1 repeat family protein [Rhodanobacteraceae bacterium]
MTDFVRSEESIMRIHYPPLLGLLWIAVLGVAPSPARGASAPFYDSPGAATWPNPLNFTSPEADARPGEKFFLYGARALKQKNFKFAIDMYRVAASWAYKPAEYNLGVMYLKGQGVPKDLPRAMAWFALAAERSDKDYVAAKEALYAALTKAQFAEANVIWRGLKKTYGDEVALRRAKTRWLRVRNNVTGSHVGAIGNLAVGGARDGGGPPQGKSGWGLLTQAGYGLTGGKEVAGSIAYRQLHESDNPYDPKFEWRLSPNPTGTATVGPLLPDTAKSGDDTKLSNTPDRQQHPF